MRSLGIETVIDLTLPVIQGKQISYSTLKLDFIPRRVVKIQDFPANARFTKGMLLHRRNCDSYMVSSLDKRNEHDENCKVYFSSWVLKGIIIATFLT